MESVTAYNSAWNPTHNDSNLLRALRETMRGLQAQLIVVTKFHGPPSTQ